jgi:NAD-dependent dihydropyrimidine dehydrogenase PreA subunit
MDGKHAIVFGTHGGMPWGQFWFLSKNILKKGMTIIGWSDWYGADFLTPHSCIPDGEWGHPDKIDLAEAEAFGRRMALNSKRIYDGETGLVPDRIPSPEVGSGSLWAPNGNGGKISFAGGVSNAFPRFDFTKCVYPRCTRCLEVCPVQSIDFSVIAPAGSITEKFLTASPLVLKEACHQCGGVCERVCLYEAISYRSDTETRSLPTIDMTKCTYPNCTICADECPQECIDLTQKPPVIHSWCEGESLCYGVCPENAITATATSVGPGSEGEMGEGRGNGGPMGGGGMPMGDARGGGGPTGQGPMAGGPPGGGMPPMGGMPGGAGGPGSNLMMGAMGGYTPRFRPLVSEECTAGKVSELTTYPRIPINKKLWPYQMEET